MNDALCQEVKSIVLLGASFSTGNLGVSALAWSSITIIKAKWPDSKVVIIGVDRTPGITKILLGSKYEELSTWPVRFCPNMLASHHIVRLLLAIILCRILPSLTKIMSNNHSALGVILQCDLVCDLTGGDSFSDIYGLPRLFRGYLLKRVCQIAGKPYIMLPQTYGPFRSMLARRLARKILINTETIYSRDLEGIKLVEELIGPTTKLRLCPDVAFILEPFKPTVVQVAQIEKLKANGQIIIGLNVSGLLYNGGYTRDNMFGLACNYNTLMYEVISSFIARTDHHVLLIPHVLPNSNFSVEDDLNAAKQAVKSISKVAQSKVSILERGYNQNETKYFIGLCDFFLGSRMHATIAAISQGVPAVGLAYSGKFAGVFETAGVSNCVLDLRALNNEAVISGIKEIFKRKDEISLLLRKTVPELKRQLYSMLD